MSTAKKNDNFKVQDWILIDWSEENKTEFKAA
jgi:hypothetical protein